MSALTVQSDTLIHNFAILLRNFLIPIGLDGHTTPQLIVLACCALAVAIFSGWIVRTIWTSMWPGKIMSPVDTAILDRIERDGIELSIYPRSAGRGRSDVPETLSTSSPTNGLLTTRQAGFIDEEVQGYRNKLVDMFLCSTDKSYLEIRHVVVLEKKRMDALHETTDDSILTLDNTSLFLSTPVTPIHHRLRSYKSASISPSNPPVSSGVSEPEMTSPSLDIPEIPLPKPAFPAKIKQFNKENARYITPPTGKTAQ